MPTFHTRPTPEPCGLPREDLMHGLRLAAFRALLGKVKPPQRHTLLMQVFGDEHDAAAAEALLQSESVLLTTW